MPLASMIEKMGIDVHELPGDMIPIVGREIVMRKLRIGQSLTKAADEIFGIIEMEIAGLGKMDRFIGRNIAYQHFQSVAHRFEQCERKAFVRRRQDIKGGVGIDLGQSFPFDHSGQDDIVFPCEFLQTKGEWRFAIGITGDDQPHIRFRQLRERLNKFVKTFFLHKASHGEDIVSFTQSEGIDIIR